MVLKEWTEKKDPWKWLVGGGSGGENEDAIESRIANFGRC